MHDEGRAKGDVVRSSAGPNFVTGRLRTHRRIRMSAKLRDPPAQVTRAGWGRARSQGLEFVQAALRVLDRPSSSDCEREEVASRLITVRGPHFPNHLHRRQVSEARSARRGRDGLA